MTDLFDLTGHRALVTGASRGIGLAIAAGLTQRGAALAITGRKANTLEAAASHLRAGGANVLPLVCHQGDPAAVAALFDQLDRHGFTADIVVVNAATNTVMGSLLDVDLAAWHKILEVNLTGALLTAQHACRRMKAWGKGSLVFVASVAGIEPMPGIGAFSVSKAGLLGLTRARRRNSRPMASGVNALAAWVGRDAVRLRAAARRATLPPHHGRRADGAAWATRRHRRGRGVPRL
jgi:NAD(P)-dependent dehydrogenase (short-subunit alcohol dehydrogenase family)